VGYVGVPLPPAPRAGTDFVSDARATAAPAPVWRQTVVITLAAIALFFLVRWLPLADGSLHYSDFGAGERGFLEFCEPGSPQFAPVDRVHSPVTLTLRTDEPLRLDGPARVTAQLTTASGKPITADDLLVVHTRKLHLLLIAADTLDDYQHVHPEPGDEAGTFVFTFIPRRLGRYRVFADFMPRATGRSLYAGAELKVTVKSGIFTGSGPAFVEGLHTKKDGLVFRLTLDRSPVRINQTAQMVLTVAREQGGAPELEDIMGAPAHLVAFDERCSGFAHLHPAAPTAEVPDETDAGRRLAFAIHLPDPGNYRLWAQVRVDGREVFAPFDLKVEP
jgi:hypothetical protein